MLDGAQFQRFREFLRLAALLRHPLRHHGVVAAGVRVGLGSQALAQREVRAAGGDGGGDGGIVCRVDHHGHIGMVLGCRAHHGRAADVDVLDAVIVGAVGFGHRGGEGVEVHHQQVDGGDAVLGHHGVIDATTAQQTAMHLRMQRLHTTIHHFREARVRGDFRDGQAGAGQQLGGDAGTQQRDAGSMQLLRELEYARFVRDREQCATDDHVGTGVGMISRQDRIPSTSCGACRG